MTDYASLLSLEKKPRPKPESSPHSENLKEKQKSAEQRQQTSPLEEKKENQINDTMKPRHHGIMQPSNHETTLSDGEEDIIESVRKAAKQIGKEAATHRFTLEEKQSLADIEYTYRRQGVRTSENEITRIAINYFIEDYKKNGENSLLAKVLKRLNA